MGPVQINSSRQRTEIESLTGRRFVSVIVDEYSNHVWVKGLKRKSEAAAHVRSVMAHFGTQGDNRSLTTDDAKEYQEKEFQDFLTKNGILHFATPPYTPQLNGKIERMMRTLLNFTRAMLSHAGLPASFWLFAVETAAYLYNRFYIRSDSTKSPREVLTGEKSSVKDLAVFGCNAYRVDLAHQFGDDTAGQKPQPRAIRGIFVGYDENFPRVYNILSLDSLTITRTRDVQFKETSFTHVESLSTLLYQSYDCLYNDSLSYDNLAFDHNDSEPSSDSAIVHEPIHQEMQSISSPSTGAVNIVNENNSGDLSGVTGERENKSDSESNISPSIPDRVEPEIPQW